MAEKTTEETTGGKYLTKDYLARNLKTFWDKIKDYITTQISGFAKTEDVEKALNSKADNTVLEALTTEVESKASSSDLNALKNIVQNKVDLSALTEITTALDGKVNKEGNKVLSDNNFENKYKTQLDNLSNATNSKDGLMSAQDKVNLDNLVRDAVTEVDTELLETSENPAQSKAISEVLNRKVDKEDAPLNPLTNLSQFLRLEGNSQGDIILRLNSKTKHFKIHAENGEVIEKFSLSGNNGSADVKFNTLETVGFNIRIPNPDGSILQEGQLYSFYIECFELLDIGKYEPFILQTKRDLEEPQDLTYSIFRI